MYDHWAPLMKVVHCTSRAPDIQRQLDFRTYVECFLLFPFYSIQIDTKHLPQHSDKIPCHCILAEISHRNEKTQCFDAPPKLTF
jgi:hypothetical protein